jgi:diguanylate cyclase (GGDEF)-like protein
MTGSILSQLLDPIKNADAKPSTRASVYLYNHLKHIEVALVRNIDDCLERNKAAIVLYVNLERYQQQYPVDYGQLAESILCVCRTSSDQGLSTVCKDSTLLCRESLWEDDFLMVLEVGRSLDLSAFAGYDSVSLVKLNKRINDEVSKTFGSSFTVRVGYSSILGRTDYLKSQIHDAIVKARKLIKHYINLKTNHLPAEFSDLIGRSAFNILYQPIVSLRTGHTLGWESFIRGPKGSYFHDPESIFCFAEDAGLLQDVEMLSWRLAMRDAGELGPEQKLFLNVHPRSFENFAFMDEAIHLVERAGLSPQKVVIEITERHDITDLAKFRKILKACRDAGFLIAIDDVGSGFSCLQAIAEIRPDFIKLSNSLVQGIHQDRARYILLETFANFAEKIGCSIIAEGIEGEADLKSLIQIGIQLGQGYFFHLPACPKPAVENKAQAIINRLVGDAPNNFWKYPLIIGEITQEAVTVDENEKVRDVKEYFEKNENVSGLVVTGEGASRGLIMRHQLDRALGTRYGVALYFDKPIRKLMDESPLVVREDAPIDSVAQLAMNRERLKHNDYIVVESGDRLKGVVSVQTILDALTKVRLEMAKGSNPLTGLPGNNAFEQEIFRRRGSGKAFSFIFVDLDHFKTYNDKYGFERGDQVLLFAARLMRSVLNKYGSGKDFLGHIGGDDYYLFTERDEAEMLCGKTIRYFDRLIRELYDAEDRQEGKVLAEDREGNEKWFPFVSLSMVIIDIDPEETLDLTKTFQALVDLKRYAKSIPGSKFVRDRRKRV